MKLIAFYWAYHPQPEETTMSDETLNKFFARCKRYKKSALQLFEEAYEWKYGYHGSVAKDLVQYHKDETLPEYVVEFLS